VARLKDGRTLAYTASFADPNQPVLVFLPGLFRGWNLSDSFIQILIQRQIGFVALEFSTQLASILSLAPLEAPHFVASPMLQADRLRSEVESLVFEHLELKKPILVSLSYSTLVSAEADQSRFPLVIETVPMGRYDETEHDTARFGRLWLDWASLNPWGWMWAEAFKTQAYTAYWSKVVAQRALGTPELLNPVTASLQIQGYVAMTRASEGFDLRDIDFSRGPKRVWILAGQENQVRSVTQSEAVEKYLATLDLAARSGWYGRQGVYTVKSAGHTLPTDEPEAYVRLLETILSRAVSSL
jgi:pimeloyl-ACP methyl ester carboxylesterase